MAFIVTKDSVIGKILAEDPKTAEYFHEYGMHCTDCPVAQSETLEEACMSHGIDVNALVQKLQGHFESK